MKTVLVWLLIVVGGTDRPAVVVERFTDLESCNQVLKVVNKPQTFNYATCVQARIAVVKE